MRNFYEIIEYNKYDPNRFVFLVKSEQGETAKNMYEQMGDTI
jgi:hypothetical protein